MKYQTKFLNESVVVASDVYRRAAYGRNHPLAIPRVETALDIAGDLGWLTGRVHSSPIAGCDLLTRFHVPDWVAALAEADRSGVVPAAVCARHGLGTMENPLFSGVFERASTSVGGSFAAARLALDGRVAFHPAGGTHHGRPDRASGFCYFNDPVFAILGFLDAGLNRVAYVDLDAHHGDGVEDAFAADPRVLTLSIHEAGRWPGTGALDDRREGRARNLPVPRGIVDDEWDLLIDEAVAPVLERFEPEAIVVTCGADGLAGDPLSSMMLSNGALWRAVVAAISIAPRAVVLGGGGYNPWTLARCWAGLWGVLAGFDLPERLPDASQARLAALDCDLVDEDDRDPAWFTTLVDEPRRGPIREEIRRIAAATRKP
ncbi:MAG: acetoin utilization protein AcuC [Hyphomicrobiales bacterium]|nr:acetoin utilization protein AcuC [Hyphomicrobiales bacterium]